MSLHLLTRYGLTREAALTTLTGSLLSFTITDTVTVAYDGQLGWRFQPREEIVVSRLRYRAPADTSSVTMTLRLWRVSDQELLRSADISTEANAYVEGAVDAITLSPDEEYIVSAYAGTGFQRDRRLASVVMDPRVLFTPPSNTHNAQFIAASSDYPASFTFEDYRANPDIMLEGNAPAYEYAVFTTSGTWDWAAAAGSAKPRWAALI